MSLINIVVTHWDDITAVGLLVGGWLWKKAHHEKTESVKDMALKLGRQVLPKIIADKRMFDDAYVNATVRKGILAGLARLNIPVTKTTTVLVDFAVEHIHDELAQQLTEYGLSEFIKVQGGTLDLMKAGA